MVMSLNNYVREIIELNKKKKAHPKSPHKWRALGSIDLSIFRLKFIIALDKRHAASISILRYEYNLEIH